VTHYRPTEESVESVEARRFPWPIRWRTRPCATIVQRRRSQATSSGAALATNHVHQPDPVSVTCESPLLVRILATLLVEKRSWRETPEETVSRWLRESATGRQLVDYLADEAGLIAMAAKRLELTGDEDLLEYARGLRAAADRLWCLAGTPPQDRV